MSDHKFDPHKPMVNFLVNGINVKFRVDTGADITVVSKDIFKLLDGVNIMSSSQILRDPHCDPLNVEGKFISKFETEDRCSNQDIYVVKSVSQPLLVCALNIFTNVNIIFHNKDSIKALFPEEFSGLGKLGKPYAINLKPDAKSFCLRTPRRIIEE